MNRARSLIGVGIGLSAVAVLVPVLIPFRASMSEATPALILVVPVVVAGLIGRRLASVTTALGAAVAFSYFFERPFDRFQIDLAADWVALVVFVVVALVVGTLVAFEADRRQAAEQRADEIRRLMAERERLRLEADRVALMEQIDAQRAALLRSVSHDLRTPLGTIRAVASDLRDGPDYTEETRDQLLDLVGAEAERLNRIVENLLSLSRIESGALQPDRQAVAIDELVADRVSKLERLFDGVKVEVDIEAALPLVDADYSQLDQVISNLLENAARHAPEASTVRISAAPEGCMMKVTVSDEGAGIQPSEVESLFEAFRRGGGSTSSGVGLAICKAMVEANGGAIGVDTNPGQGAAFHFTVPIFTVPISNGRE